MSTEDWNEFKVNTKVGTQGVPYDYESIMHYPEFIGSKRVIVPLRNISEPPFLWQSNYPSLYDYLHVNLLYCNGRYISLC